MNSPKVSIITVNWNGRETIERCLQSLREIDYSPYEIIVVDNASSDGSADFIKKSFPDVLLIESKQNLGWAGGNNMAIRRAFENGSQYVWLFNPDAISEKDTLKKLIGRAESSPSLGLLSPVLYYQSSPEQVQYCGSSLDWNEYQIRHFQNFDDLRQVPQKDLWLWGTAILIKREVIENVGYFNEKYFAYCEDREFSLRADRAGYTKEINLDSRVYHQYHCVDVKGEDNMPPHVFFYTTRNGFWFWMDNISFWGKIRFIRKYIAWIIHRIVKNHARSNSDAVDAYCDGLYWAFRQWGGFWDKSKKMPSRIKRMILGHPSLWIDLLEYRFGRIFVGIFRKRKRNSVFSDRG